MANGFEVGEGDTGVPQDIAPASASAPPTPPKSAGDAVLEVYQKYLDRQTSAQEQAPPPAGMSFTQRLGASMLAGLDPDAYAKIVVPQLQAQQHEREMAARRVQSAREREDAVFRTMLDIARYKDEREQRREAQAATEENRRENIRLRDEEAQRRRDAADEKTKLNEIENEGRQITLDVMRSRISASRSSVAGLASRLEATGDPALAAHAATLRERLEVAETALATAPPGTRSINPSLIGNLSDAIGDLQVAEQQALAALGQINLADLRAKRTVKEGLAKLDPSDRRNLPSMLALEASVLEGLTYLQQHGDVGGPVAAAGGMTFTQEQRELNAIFGDAGGAAANLRGGKNITETEIKLFGGMIPFINDTYGKKISSLTQILKDVRGKLAVLSLDPETLETMRQRVALARQLGAPLALTLGDGDVAEPPPSAIGGPTLLIDDTELLSAIGGVPEEAFVPDSLAPSGGMGGGKRRPPAQPPAPPKGATRSF